MKKNMGKIDRLIRVIIALIISTLIVTNLIKGILATVLLILAAVFLFTSFIQFCPLYTLFGINTCEKKQN
ncbi:MAG: DUF2892 domain-containing protein [Flavobacteriia bacterium]|nr:DUF2892 domain-containing protein [Flavobacteriia bacterium]